MDIFGEWLRQRRDELGLTRNEFARRIGCSIAMLRKIENDERRPSAQTAELIANGLDIPVAERETFVRVARGELRIDRLFPESKPLGQLNNSAAQTWAGPRRGNLPILPTPLIGRAREVNELCQLLRDPQCHMLTLVGMGGIGKTRLAIEVASHMQADDFANGVYFASLAPVPSSRLIVPVIADSIGFTFQGTNAGDPTTQLCNYLNQKQLLLLADNLEHLLDDPLVIESFAQLLECAPKVKLLVTSHEPFNLQGEWVFEVQGLPIPHSGDIEGTAVELFLQRARRAQVGFNATTDDYPAIVRICQLVDGMPMGIELAAAWVRTLSCAEIADEVDRELDFLAVSAQDLPVRQRSLRAIFDYSWKLLGEEEQGILLRLSVFHNGFQREAAEQVAGATLSTLATLVTKSLVRRNGTGRYDLHELIRQNALERLANQPDLQQEAQARHARYFLTFLSQQNVLMRSPVQQEPPVELIADLANIRSAQEWALANDEFALIKASQQVHDVIYDMVSLM